MYKILSAIFIGLILISCVKQKESNHQVQQWNTYEIILKAENEYGNGYLDMDVWAVFKNQNGDSLIRPAFWDGKDTWKIRFSPPDPDGNWNWKTFSKPLDGGLDGKEGILKSIPYTGSNELLKHGLLKMSPGSRNVVHADNHPFLMVAGTPWALFFRATSKDVEIYAADRQMKGFNAALLMSVQPDKRAEGPEARDSVLGFDVAFEDLKDGHLKKLKPDYFQYCDSLIDIMISHEIVPVFNPVFHGFGWKGLGSAGSGADASEYARYCKYLVARYGSKPAFWLVGADGNGLAPGIKAGGEMIEQWDAYHQPTGIHYNPCGNDFGAWAPEDSSGCFHYNKSHQDAMWLDFQWAQSGHNGEHLVYKVKEMFNNQPTKAVANGEPTYEGMMNGTVGLGWWQGHNAWLELMNGGTMGVVYGAASLWQWKVREDEPGWEDWCEMDLSWQGALDLKGSTYVGYVSKAFEGFNFTDMEPRPDLINGENYLLCVPGVFYISYLEMGGEISISGLPADIDFYWYNPKTGDLIPKGKTGTVQSFVAPSNDPWVFIAGNKTS